MYFLVKKRLDPKYRALERLGARQPALLSTLSGGAYSPNPRAADFDVERLVFDLDPEKVWRTPGQATGGAQARVASVEALRQARLERFGQGQASCGASASSSSHAASPLGVRPRVSAAATPAATHGPPAAPLPPQPVPARGDVPPATPCAPRGVEVAPGLTEDERFARKLAVEEDELFARQLAAEGGPGAVGERRSPVDVGLQFLDGFAQAVGVLGNELDRALRHVILPSAAHGADSGRGRSGRDSVSIADLDRASARMYYEGPSVGARSAEPTSIADVASQDQCAVCMDTFLVGAELRLLPCFHRFHLECIDPWLRQCQECPTCKHHIAT